MLRILLFPLAVLYDLVTTLRNTLYDRGSKPSAGFEVPVISVGNLDIGGTGKTTMVEYLIRLLHPSFRVATLSRGYGRSTKGFRIVSATEGPATVGDEPWQLFRKFEGRANVTVGGERALSIPQIMAAFEDTGVILLDDAFQHRQVRPALQILLSDFSRPFYKDFLLPAGRLRESRKGASRADIIVITKCPRGLGNEEMMAISREVRRYADKPVFFCTLRYGELIAPGNVTGPAGEKIVVVTGVAKPGPMMEFLKERYVVIKHFDFPDHYAYKDRDVREICRCALDSGASVVTTEKDAAKLQEAGFNTLLKDVPFFYLPVENEFLKNGKEFDEMVLNVLDRRHVS